MRILVGTVRLKGVSIMRYRLLAPAESVRQPSCEQLLSGWRTAGPDDFVFRPSADREVPVRL